MVSHQHTRGVRARCPALLAGGAAVLCTALFATGCESAFSTTASGDADRDADRGAAFSDVRFDVGARGGIQLSGASRDAVTPMGAHPASAGRPYTFDRPDGTLLVVLRHWPDVEPEHGVERGWERGLERGLERASRGRVPRIPTPEEAAVETGFLVDTAHWVRADLDGHPLRWLRRDTIRIDTTNVAAGDVTRLTLSAPHGGRRGQPGPPPGADAACEGADDRAVHLAALPEVAPGAPVVDVLERLRAQCLDVQYASLPGGAPPGTVARVLIPLAGSPDAVAAVLSEDGVGLPGRTRGGTVPLDPRRPVTVVVAR